MNRPPRRSRPVVGAFTLVELMVSMAVLTLLLAITWGIIANVSGLMSRTRGKVDTFQEGRAAFETVTRRLSQAMLNTYWDYDFPDNDRSKAPLRQAYVRQSELHFICGPTKDGAAPLLPDATLQSATHAVFFQAPLGYSAPAAGSPLPGANLPNLLNVDGYFLEYSSDRADRPKFLQTAGSSLPDRWRSRLMEFSQPTEGFSVYRVTDQPTAGNSHNWFLQPLGTSGSGLAATRMSRRVLAENIVALVIRAGRSPQEPLAPGASRQLAPNYLYDSRRYLAAPTDPLASLTRNQLPPMVHVTMVAIDEPSASRLQDRLTKPELMPVQDLGLGELFQRPSKSLQPTADEEGDQYREDLQALESRLTALKLSYRTFTTDVAILQAKWSEN